MISREITSLQHPIVKRFVKLREDKSLRQEEQSVLISGVKLISEISQHTPLKRLICAHSFPDLHAQEIYHATPEILKKITGVQNPEGIAAEVALPAPADLKNSTRLLILDKLSDPGNVGTLLRTALALGWDGAFLTLGTADPFNEKAIRAAKGATFRLPLKTGSWEALNPLLSERRTFVADLQGEPPPSCPHSQPIALILGNESHGPSIHAKGSLISIPMTPLMESLNVASAGAILMHSLTTQPINIH